MKTLILTTIIAGIALADVPANCIDKTCVFSTNTPYDGPDEPDTRKGTWGNAGYDDLPIPFVGVPRGYRVRITRVYGDFIAWPHGRPIPDTYAGALFGIIASSATQSPFVGPGLGSSKCFIFLQQGVSALMPARAPFDFQVQGGGLLDRDNIMIVRRASFLNEMGVPIHMEPTFVVEFRYEKDDDSGN